MTVRPKPQPRRASDDAHASPLREEDLTLDRMGVIQARAWEETFRYAFRRSPFYGAHFRKAGIGPRSRPSLDALSHIPTITKQELSEHTDQFLCVPRERIAEVVTTSGSTGRPLLFPMTDSDLRRLALNEYFSFRCAGLDSRDTVILAVTLDRCFVAGLAYYLGLRQLGCTVIRIGPATPQIHFDMLKRVKATAVVGVPSFLALLAERARDSGVRLKSIGVRKLICIGESVRGEDLALNPTARSLERAWGARVLSTYGVTELAASLCECEAGCGGHLHPSLLYLEALDERGAPVPDGEVGELTATTFGVEAMPLIRYRTGDFAALHSRRCACGRYTRRIGPVVGRGNQKLKLKGTTLFPSALKLALDAVPEVKSYVIIARPGDGFSDDVEVRIACDGAGASVTRRLREQFQGVAKVVPRIQLAKPASIEAMQMPDGSRKRRYFVDLRIAS